MSATTPAIQGGTSSQRLGAALAAVALAIVALIAIVGLSAAMRPATTAAPVAAPAPGSLFDRGWMNDRGKGLAPAFSVAGDHGAVLDGSASAPIAPVLPDSHGSVTGTITAAPVVLPRVFDPYHNDAVAAPVTLPRVFDPYHNDSTTNGGRGTWMAR